MDGNDLYAIFLLPDFLKILFLLVNVTHSGARFVLATVLAVAGLTGFAPLGAVMKCDVIFTRCFSIFCHDFSS